MKFPTSYIKLLFEMLTGLHLKGKSCKSPQKNGVYYINGATKLPAPLDAEAEAKCLEMLCCQGAQRENAKNTLVEHNLRLVVYIAKKFESTGIGLEDLVSIGTIGLMKAINTFHPEKNIKLATYASRCIENEILMYLRKNANTRVEVSLDEPLNVDWDGNELLLSDVLGTDGDTVSRNLEEQEERSFVRTVVSHLCERDRRIIEMRFGIRTDICGTYSPEPCREKTQKEVADILGISQSYISRLEKRIIEELKEEIEAFYNG